MTDSKLLKEMEMMMMMMMMKIRCYGKDEKTEFELAGSNCMIRN